MMLSPMEIDPVLKVKVIYFLEKRAELKEKGDYLFDPKFATHFYITSKDISTVIKILKSEGIYKLETKFRTVLDRKGAEEIAGSEYEEEYWGHMSMKIY